jgi:hypothetical protein
MSGGAYNYAYSRFEDFAYQLSQRASTPERKAFIKLVKNVAKAAREIEWQDSGDGGDEEKAIRDALGEKHGELVLDVLIEEAEEILKALNLHIRHHKS